MELERSPVVRYNRTAKVTTRRVVGPLQADYVREGLMVMGSERREQSPALLHFVNRPKPGLTGQPLETMLSQVRDNVTLCFVSHIA